MSFSILSSGANLVAQTEPDWKPIWEGKARNDFLANDLPIDMSIENAEEKALSMAPALIGARLIDRVAVAFGRYGTDYLQHMIRRYAEKGWRLEDLRSGVFARTGGKPMQIPIQSAQSERTHANEILRLCGLDFIEFVADSDRLSYELSSPLPIDEGRYRRWRWIRTSVNAAVAFGAAVTGGAIEASAQHRAIEMAGDRGPSFGAQMRPYIGMGTAAGGLELVFGLWSNWFNKHFWSSREKPLKPELTFKSMVDIVGRILWPRGFYASLAFNTAIPVALVQIGKALAEFPGSPVHYNAPSALELASGIALFTVSLGAGQIGLSRLLSRGGISEMHRYIFESVSGWINNVGRCISLVPGLGFAGQLVMGLFAVSVTGPLWFKIKVGDRAYNLHTAEMLNPEAKRLGFFGRKCSSFVGWLSNVIDFRRVRLSEPSGPGR